MTSILCATHSESKLTALTPVEIDGINYYLATEAMPLAPVYFGKLKPWGLTKEKYNLAREVDCKFMRLDKKSNTWMPSAGNAPKVDKVFLTERFLLKIREINNSEGPIVDASGVELAPDILELEDSEMLRDTDGNVLDTEVRGKRSEEDILFRVDDVSKALELPNIYQTRLSTNSNYEEGTHYKRYTVEKVCNVYISNSIQNEMRKALYLTMEGFVKVIYGSRSGSAAQYRKWAQRILFVAQMGTRKQRSRVADSIKYGSYQAVAHVDSLRTIPTSCIYLFKIDTVANLRAYMSIPYDMPDDACVYKWGETESLSRRFKEHHGTYDHLIDDDDKLELIKYAPIPRHFTGEAEDKLKVKVLPYKQKYQGRQELIVVKPNELDTVLTFYTDIGAMCNTTVDDFAKRVIDMKDELADPKLESATLKGQVEVLKLQYEIAILKAEEPPKKSKNASG